MAHPEVFVRTITEKLTIYALGRGLDARDMPAVRAIIRDAAGGRYRFSSIVLGIVRSTPFTMRVAAAAGKRELEASICTYPGCRFHGERSCAAWARRSRCRFSTR